MTTALYDFAEALRDLRGLANTLHLIAAGMREMDAGESDALSVGFVADQADNIYRRLDAVLARLTAKPDAP